MRRLLRSGRLESLLRHDQLRKEMAAGRVFVVRRKLNALQCVCVGGGC
jgi:hypothetical protein